MELVIKATIFLKSNKVCCFVWNNEKSKTTRFWDWVVIAIKIPIVRKRVREITCLQVPLVRES